MFLTALLFIVLVLGSIFIGANLMLSAPTYRGPVSDHFDGKRFFNPGLDLHKSFFDLLKWQTTASRTKWPKSVPVERRSLPAADEKPVVTYVGQATFLVRAYGKAILTDPNWSEIAGPWNMIGPRRVSEPGVTLEDLPQIDLVVISHAHYDHFDLPTVGELSRRFNPLFITGLGNAALLQRAGARRFKELDWWQSSEISHGFRVTMTPSQHWSSRSFFDRCRTLWGGYLIEVNQTKLLFIGDSGYGKVFTDIRSRLGSPDLAILPIGAYEPRWFMKASHMNPAEALAALADLGAKQGIASHYATFQLSDEGIDHPLTALYDAEKRQPDAERRFIALKIGESVAVQP